MRIQFAAPLRNRYGDEIKERNPATGEMHTATLADVCCNVLDAQLQEDKDPKDKVRRWELIRAITKAEKELQPLDMLNSDVEMLKDRILRSGYPASVSGYACDLIKPVEEGHASDSGARGRKAGNAQVQARTASQREQQGASGDGQAAGHSDSSF